MPEFDRSDISRSCSANAQPGHADQPEAVFDALMELTGREIRLLGPLEAIACCRNAYEDDEKLRR